MLALATACGPAPTQDDVVPPDDNLDAVMPFGNVEEGAVDTSTAVGYSDQCLQRHFAQAISLGLPVPSEVRFYCARPWDFDALGEIDRRLQAAGVDPVEPFVAMVPPDRQDVLRQVTHMALEQAEHGPPGMRAAWMANRFVPVLYGLHSSESETLRSIAGMREQDVIALRRVAEGIDWNACVVSGGCHGQDGLRMSGVTQVAFAALRSSESQ